MDGIKNISEILKLKDPGKNSNYKPDLENTLRESK